MSKLDPEFKARWLAALRSGELRQAREELQSEEDLKAFCCLGVAAMCANPFRPQGDYGVADFTIGNDRERSPEGYWYNKALGMSDEMAVELARRNDCGYSFTAIADFIEANY